MIANLHNVPFHYAVIKHLQYATAEGISGGQQPNGLEATDQQILEPSNAHINASKKIVKDDNNKEENLNLKFPSAPVYRNNVPAKHVVQSYSGVYLHLKVVIEPTGNDARTCKMKRNIDPHKSPVSECTQMTSHSIFYLWTSNCNASETYTRPLSPVFLKICSSLTSIK